MKKLRNKLIGAVAILMVLIFTSGCALGLYQRHRMHQDFRDNYRGKIIRISGTGSLYYHVDSEGVIRKVKKEDDGRFCYRNFKDLPCLDANTEVIYDSGW